MEKSSLFDLLITRIEELVKHGEYSPKYDDYYGCPLVSLVSAGRFINGLNSNSPRIKSLLSLILDEIKYRVVVGEWHPKYDRNVPCSLASIVSASKLIQELEHSTEIVEVTEPMPVIPS